MIIDKNNASELTVRDYPTLPDLKSGKWKVVPCPFDEDFSILLQKNPVPVGEDAMVALLYSATLMKDGKAIHTASIEAIDLRLISYATGTPLRTLQNEHNVKGHILEPHLILYGNSEREDIGPYLGSLDEDEVYPFLSSVIEDSTIPAGEEDDFSSWIFDEDDE